LELGLQAHYKKTCYSDEPLGISDTLQASRLASRMTEHSKRHDIIAGVPFAQACGLRLAILPNYKATLVFEGIDFANRMKS